MMSILETFYILFKSDASQVKKGSEEAKKSTEDLNSSLKNINDSTTLVSDSFLNLGKSLAGIVAGFFTASTILNNIREAYAYTLQINQLSKALNVNGEDLDVWGAAVRRNGGSLEGFASTVKSLGASLNIRNQDVFKLLPRLADVFAKAGPDKALRFASKLGIDEGTTQVLLKGRKAVEELILREKELGVITKQNEEVAKKFNQAWSDTSRAFQSMWIQVAQVVLPILTSISESFTKMAIYFRDHKDLVVGALIAISVAAGIAAGAFVLLNLPLVLIIATIGSLIAIFAIAYEDIQAFRHGNNSLINDLLNKWPMVGKVIKSVFEGIKETIDFVLSAYDKVKSILGIGGNQVNNNQTFESAQKSINDAIKSPIMAQTSNSIFNSGISSSNRSASINTGPITINTQATDGAEVGGALARGLRDQLRQATGTFDDGVLA